MLYTRRDLGKLALAAGAASPLFAAKPNSNFGGVQIGAITYSFRALPSSAEEVLKYCLDCGISAIELMSNVAEGYAGSPQQAGRGAGGGAGRGPAPSAAEGRGAGGGQGRGEGRGRGGRGATPEQQAAMQKAQQELKDWRLSRWGFQMPMLTVPWPVIWQQGAPTVPPIYERCAKPPRSWRWARRRWTPQVSVSA